MEVKPEVPNGAPVVKNENQNAQGSKQMQGGGPSGNKFNNSFKNNDRNNPRQNKNFQPKGNRNMPMQHPMRGPPKGEVSEFFKACSAIFLYFLLLFLNI